MTTPDASARPTVDASLPDPVAAPELPDDVTGRWPQLRPIGSRYRLRDYLAEMWRRREFAITVPLGQLRAQNQASALGQVWHLLNPLMLIGIYYLIFGVILGVEGRRGVEEYLPFLIVGIITYNYTRSTVQAGAKMIVKNRKLVSSINFPRAILPVSAVVAESVSHLFAVPVMLVMALLVGGQPTAPRWSWFLLVPILLVHAAFNLGLAMIVARLTFHFRDVQQFLPYLLRLYLYASGVLIPINADLITHDGLRSVLQANPMFHLIEMSRAAVIGSTPHPWVWVLGPAWAVGLLVAGFWFFRNAESEYGRV